MLINNDKELFITVCDICKEFTKLKLISMDRLNKFYKTHKNNNFLLKFEHKKLMRLDLSKKKNSEHLRLRKLLENNNINVSKILYSKQSFDKRFFVFSEWISGTELSKILSDINLDTILFSKFGEMVARINKITENELMLSNTDLNQDNIIINKNNELFIVDHGRLRFITNEERSEEIIRLLLKRIKIKERINIFLKAYEKYFEIKEIIEKCNYYNWVWNESEATTRERRII